MFRLKRQRWSTPLMLLCLLDREHFREHATGCLTMKLRIDTAILQICSGAITTCYCAQAMQSTL